jgi:hypothetical protein
MGMLQRALGKRPYFIPWKWNDPWVRVTAALSIPVVVLVVARFWWEVPALWLWAAFCFLFAAMCYRNLLYLRQSGQRPDYQIMFRAFSVVLLVFGIILTVLFLLGPLFW